MWKLSIKMICGRSNDNLKSNFSGEIKINMWFQGGITNTDSGRFDHMANLVCISHMQFLCLMFLYFNFGSIIVNGYYRWFILSIFK